MTDFTPLNTTRGVDLPPNFDATDVTAMVSAPGGFVLIHSQKLGLYGWKAGVRYRLVPDTVVAAPVEARIDLGEANGQAPAPAGSATPQGSAHDNPRYYLGGKVLTGVPGIEGPSNPVPPLIPESWPDLPWTERLHLARAWAHEGETVRSKEDVARVLTRAKTPTLQAE